MKRFLSPCLAAVIGLSSIAPTPWQPSVVHAAEAAAAVEVADRNDVTARTNAFVANIKAGHLAGAMKAMMTAEQWQTSVDSFEASKNMPEAAEGMPAPKDPMAETAANLAKLQDPAERAKMVDEARPQLAQMDLNQNAMMVGMASGMLNMKLQDQENPLPPESAAAVQEILNIVTAVAAWMPGSKMNDEATLTQALDIIGQAAETWPHKTADELRALDFEATLGFYGHFRPALIEAAALYNLDLQAMIDGLEVIPAGDFNGMPAFDLIIPLFGQPLTVPLAWEVSEGGEPQMSGARAQERFQPLIEMGMGMMGFGGGPGPGPGGPGPGMGNPDAMPPGM